MSTQAKKKILVVDDDLTIRTMILDILSEAGYIAAAAEDGKKALQLLNNNIYHLIVSDVNMPEMDGISLFRRITEDLPELKKRFLFITGNPTNEVLSFFKLNNLEYITKPFQMPDILDKVISMTKDEINLKGRNGMYWRREERFCIFAHCEIFVDGKIHLMPLVARMQDISRSGAKIRHIGKSLIPNTEINIHIIDLNLNIDAKVVWTKTVGSGEFLTGLNFAKQIPLPKGFINAV